MTCPVCGGCGWILKKKSFFSFFFSGFSHEMADCKNCKGTGTIDTPDIIEGCGGVVKGYKEDEGDA